VPAVETPVEIRPVTTRCQGLPANLYCRAGYDKVLVVLPSTKARHTLVTSGEKVSHMMSHPFKFMSLTRLDLLCLVEDDSQVFGVKVATNCQILDLKELILEKCKNTAPLNLAIDLILQKALTLLSIPIDFVSAYRQVNADLSGMKMYAVLNFKVKGQWLRNYDAIPNIGKNSLADECLSILLGVRSLHNQFHALCALC
jgi:hypothetical protein